MNELEREFIRQSTADLHDISTRISENASADLHENFLNETFRTLHTIKGTAQTFGFSNAGILAHLLENLVESAKKGNASKNFHKIFREGILLLIDSFEQENFRIPPHFAEKIGDFQINIDARELSADFPEDFPETISAQLSAQEKSNLSAAFRKEKSIFILEIGFGAVNFAEKFKQFREDLS